SDTPIRSQGLSIENSGFASFASPFFAALSKKRRTITSSFPAGRSATPRVASSVSWMNGSMSAQASSHSSSPKRSTKRTIAIPSRSRSSTAARWTSFSGGWAEPSAGGTAVPLEDSGGGVNDGVEVYHVDAEVGTDGQLLLGEPATPVGPLRIVARRQPAEHLRGRERREMRVVDEADRVDHRGPLR